MTKINWAYETYEMPKQKYSLRIENFKTEEIEAVVDLVLEYVRDLSNDLCAIDIGLGLCVEVYINVFHVHGEERVYSLRRNDATKSDLISAIFHLVSESKLS